MSKLKLGAIADDKPVRITVELPAAVHRDLLAYAELLGSDDPEFHGHRSRLRKGETR